MYEATEYLLDLYRNDTLKEPSNIGPLSVRWGCANALYKIKDPRYQKEYRELINILGMWDGGWLMIELLGKFKTEDNYEFILTQVCSIRYPFLFFVTHHCNTYTIPAPFCCIILKFRDFCAIIICRQRKLLAFKTKPFRRSLQFSLH